jgi:NADH pyrophosphatase NudC (nudix superfamily)
MYISSRPWQETLSLLIACQTRIFLGISINYRYDLDNERWFGRGASLEKFKEKSGQKILNLEGGVVWSSLIQDS